MKQSKSQSLEPLPIRRNKQNSTPGDDHRSSSLQNNDASPTGHTSENELTTDKLLKRICDELKGIRDVLDTRVHDKEEQRCEDDKENEIKKDWMLASAVLDRICAFAFTIVFVGGTLVFFYCVFQSQMTRRLLEFTIGKRDILF